MWTEKAATDGGAKLKSVPVAFSASFFRASSLTPCCPMRSYRETIFRLLNLPAVTVGEYKLNSEYVPSRLCPGLSVASPSLTDPFLLFPRPSLSSLIQTTTLSSRPTTLERGLSRDVRRGNGNHASTPGGETGESTTSRDL